MRPATQACRDQRERVNTMHTTIRTGSHLALALFVLGLTGCAGHGQYTQAFRNEANQRMSEVKAGTQWDMAQQQFLSGDLEKALKTVDSSIAMAPNVAKSYLLRGRIMLELGRLEPSLNSFDQAIKLDDKLTDAYFFKGVVLERYSEHQQALECYTKAASLDRANAQYPIAAAEMLIQLGRLDEAKALLDPPADSQLPRYPHSAGVRQTLGHIAMIEHDATKAITLFREACTLAPDELFLVEDLARAQYAAKQFGDAEASLRRVLAKDDSMQRRDLRLLQARCMIETERLSDARALLVKLTSGSAGEGDADAWLQLGNVSLVLKDQTRLREAGNHVIALSPQRYEGYLLLGLYQRNAGKLQQAADLLAKSAQLSTDDPAPAILAGLVNEQLGSTAVTKSNYERALAISPTNERAAMLLQKINSGQNSAVAGAPQTND